MMIQQMIEVKERLRDAGYPESAFSEAYWTSKNTSAVGARIEKDPSPALCYFEDLVKMKGIPKGSFLDIGAGAGNMVHAFREHGWRAKGCEYSETGRKLAKERYGIELRPCDLRKGLPYDTSQFDWAMCNGVLSMIPKKYMLVALEEILRVAKFGVLITVGTRITVNPENELDGNPHHITALSAEEYWQRICVTIGAVDMTSILPPQKSRYGIAVGDEFGGLFSKSRFCF